MQRSGGTTLLSEEAIRPERLRRENATIRERERERFLARFGHVFVHVDCPACGGREREEAFAKQGFRFVRCPDCATLWIDPRPDEAMLAEFYGESEALRHFERMFAASEEVRRERIHRPRAQALDALCRERGLSGTFLDLGAGYGTFADEVRRLGRFRRVLAGELSSHYAEICRQRGLEVIEEPVERVSLEEPADVITAFELIEHLFVPERFVRRVRELLAPDGLFVLSTPNAMGFDLLTLGPRSHTLEGPNHLNYFNPGSLPRLLDRCGLRVVSLETPGQLDAGLVRDALLAGRLGDEPPAFLSHVLVERWESLAEPFQAFLREHHLSSHMLCVATPASPT